MIDFGKGLGRWNTMPMRDRISVASTSDAYRLDSSNRICPSTRAVGIRSFIRLKQRSSVLLPHPEGPISAVMAYRFTSMLMSLSARKVS